ncbi:MAG: hypothetical protein GXO86_10655 [Chlorobi bacterium]|nr:hypothetical protein [Chlorobiota bacterium]
MILKKYSRLFIAVILLCCIFVTVSAQTPPVEKPKPKRPKVGLVMSGGGAKGFAYIGLLKVLQEVGLEVDYIQHRQYHCRVLCHGVFSRFHVGLCPCPGLGCRSYR